MLVRLASFRINRIDKSRHMFQPSYSTCIMSASLGARLRCSRNCIPHNRDEAGSAPASIPFGKSTALHYLLYRLSSPLYILARIRPPCFLCALTQGGRVTVFCGGGQTVKFGYKRWTIT